MTLAIKIIMLILSIIIIVAVCLQEGRSDGLSGAIGGGTEQLFGKRRTKAYDALLHKVTFVSVILFFLVSIIALII